MNPGGPRPQDIAHCRACGADMVYLRTKNGARMPVNVMPTDASFRGPNAGELVYIHREYQSHFITCPEAGRFRQRDKP